MDVKNLEAKSLVLNAGSTKFVFPEGKFISEYGDELGADLESQLVSNGKVKLGLRLKSSFNNDTPKPYRLVLQSDQELSREKLVSVLHFGTIPEQLTPEQLADLPRLSSSFELGERLPSSVAVETLAVPTPIPVPETKP